MNLNIQDKVFLVTGGARGIGEGISRSLAAEGANIVIVGRDQQTNLQTVNSINDAGGVADYFTAELSEAEECFRAVEYVGKKYGKIDGLINNAGINDKISLEFGTYKQFMQSIQNNLAHYFLMAKHCLPYLIQSKGSIVNISSKVAETGQGGTSAYAAANGGRNALTREWAVELLKYGIRVNAVIVAECYTPLYHSLVGNLPNTAEIIKEITSRIPLENRFTTKEEIAAMVAFLVSDRSSHTTGQLIHVDGGYVHLDRGLH